MENPRWWHVAVTATAVVLVAILAVSQPTALEVVLGGAGIALLATAWFVIGPKALSNPRYATAMLVLLPIACGLAVAGNPTLAIMQSIAYPLAWVVADGNTRRAIIANIAIGLTVMVGFIVRLGLPEGLLIGAIGAGLSVVFAIALGLWITSIARLSEERKALLTELQDAQAELAAAHRDAGVVSERERLAREIHDTIAQDLTGLVLLTQRARRELAAGDVVTADGQLALIEENARATLAETRSLVSASAPVGLEAGGLGDALERLGARFSRETSVEVTVDAAASPALDRDSQVVLLRIAQEGLANVRKHAGAGSASIRIESGVDDVSLVVADDGAGFDVDAPSTGFGLPGMRERLALVGGTLNVSSSPGGTVLTARLPLGLGGRQ
jgi:signal transduction histidine kinase